jgi:3-carboxy-cis,cis-muconate cycloisomerase
LSPDLLSPVAAGTAADKATSGEAWLRALLDAEAALARAQARLGMIPDGVAEAIAGAHVDLEDLAVRARGAGNPVVPLVADLRKIAGEHVHRGATSQDIMDTAAMLVADRTRPTSAARSTPWPRWPGAIGTHRWPAVRSASRPCRRRSGCARRAG